MSAGVYTKAPCPEAAAVEPPAQVTCGTVIVPEGHDRAGGATVKLPVAVVTHPGTATNPPVVFLDGGPGGDSLSAAKTLAALPFATTRSLVLVGQRGSPFAEPTLDCPEVEQRAIDQLDQALDDSSLQASNAALRTCFQRVEAGGAALDTYDTVSAADDLEAVRLALGHGRWDLYGVSYGTRLALEVMRRHPEGVRRVVLDSVYPPDVESYATLIPGAERAFGEIVAACGEDSTCAPLAPTLRSRFVALYRRLERQPVDAKGTDPETDAPVTVRWDGTRLAQALFSAMYSSALIPLLPNLLASIEGGDFSVATTYYLPFMRRSLHGAAEGLYVAVECRERAPFSDPDEVQRVADAAAPWLVDAVTSETSLGACDAWKATPLDSPARAVESDLPTLVMAGRFDPITPPAWGRQAARTLPNSHFVLLPTGGHVEGFDTCGAAVMASFLDDAAAVPDTGCASDKKISWSLP